MATDSIEARATASGFTGLRLIVIDLTSLGLLVLLKPQSMVLLVQDIWFLVLVVRESWLLIPLKPQLMVLLVQDTRVLVLVVTEPWVLKPEPQPVLLQGQHWFLFRFVVVTELWVLKDRNMTTASTSPELWLLVHLVLLESEPWLLVVLAKDHSSTKTDRTPESRSCWWTNRLPRGLGMLRSAMSLGLSKLILITDWFLFLNSDLCQSLNLDSLQVVGRSTLIGSEGCVGHKDGHC